MINLSDSARPRAHDYLMLSMTTRNVTRTRSWRLNTVRTDCRMQVIGGGLRDHDSIL